MAKTIEQIIKEERVRFEATGRTVSPEIEAEINAVKMALDEIYSDGVTADDEESVLKSVRGAFNKQPGDTDVPATVTKSEDKKNLPKKLNASTVLKDVPEDDLKQAQNLLDGMCSPEDRALNSRMSTLNKLLVSKLPNSSWIQEGATGKLSESAITDIEGKLNITYNSEENEKAKAIIKHAKNGGEFKIRRTLKPSSIIGVVIKLATESNPSILTMDKCSDELFLKTYGGIYDKSIDAGVSIKYLTKVSGGDNGLEREETYMKATVSGKDKMFEAGKWEATHELVEVTKDIQKLPIEDSFLILVKNEDGSIKKNAKGVNSKRKVYPRVEYAGNPVWQIKPEYAEAGFTQAKAFGVQSMVKFDTQEDIDAAVANMQSMLIRLAQGVTSSEFKNLIDTNSKDGDSGKESTEI